MKNNKPSLEKQEAELLLKDELIDHEKHACSCYRNKKISPQTMCYAGMWLSGVITNKQVIEDRKHDA